jgi:hypothetical protein
MQMDIYVLVLLRAFVRISSSEIGGKMERFFHLVIASAATCASCEGVFWNRADMKCGCSAGSE